MRQGRVQKVNWSNYQTTKFSFPKRKFDEIECGTSALYCITKRPINEINKLARKDGHWPDVTMRRFLQKHNFTTIPITWGSMVGSQSVHDDKNMLSPLNVVLLSQHCYKEEGTWSVLYNYQIYHGGEVLPIRPMEFLNYPIDSAYAVWHPSWKMRRPIPDALFVKKAIHELISSIKIE